jgi:ceramide glucosyltransferase
MKAMPWRDRALALLLGLGTAFGPVLFAIGLAIWPWTWGLAVAYALVHFLSFAHIRFAYLHRSTRWRWAWLVPVIQVLLPIQLAVALIAPQRIDWRGHIMQIEPGGGFRFISRRRGA